MSLLIGMVLLSICYPLVTGCGYTQGAALYMMGLGKAKMVEARFHLTDNAVLILVDDPRQQITWPAAKRQIMDALAQELLRTGSAKKIVPPRTLDQIRQSLPNYSKVSCREIGKLAGAEQVLWLEVEDFFASEQFRNASEAAHLIVTVKVINVLEEKMRSKVRVWPPVRSGQPVSAALGGAEVAGLKTTDAISAALASRLAVSIARFFHDYRPGDFERSE